MEGKGKLATKLGTKCIKPRKPQEAPYGPYGVSVMDEKGDLKLRDQGYLRSTFTYFNLPPQGRSPEVSSHSVERGNRGSEGFHVTGHGRAGV